MLQIDADLGWSPDAPRRMMESDKPLIGGAYPLKTDLINHIAVSDQGLPGGFLMVKREVIEKMSQGLPKYKCASLPYGELHVAPLFTREMRPDGYTGEDFMFCKRAKQSGFDFTVEPDIDFSHIGIKAWKGNYKQCQFG